MKLFNLIAAVAVLTLSVNVYADESLSSKWFYDNCGNPTWYKFCDGLSLGLSYAVRSRVWDADYAHGKIDKKTGKPMNGSIYKDWIQNNHIPSINATGLRLIFMKYLKEYPSAFKYDISEAFMTALKYQIPLVLGENGKKPTAWLEFDLDKVFKTT